MEQLGLLLALAVLIVMALRGINIIVAALTATLIVLVSNGMDIAQGFTESFTFGKLGAFSFMGRFFLLFVAGAVFGTLMARSGYAKSIADTLALRLGSHRALWIIALACAVLTYGGVSAFVVLFTVNALAQQLIVQAGIPKNLMVGAVALGAGTFTLTAMPGTPSLNNILAASALGTDLYAAPLLGIIGSLMMFALGIWYLERKRIALGVTQAAGAPELSEPSETSPHPWWLASLPLFVVILLIALPKLLPEQLPTALSLFDYARAQPIFWPVISLLIGCLAIVLTSKTVRNSLGESLGEGASSSVMPVLNTAMVIGFGSVVSQTQSFQWFVDSMLTLELPPMLSLLSSVSVIAGITGSSSGGLQIFLQTMGQSFVELGLAPEVVHRLAAMASGGLDSLPHCGGVIAFLTIMGSNHKESYKEIAVVSVAIPILVTLVCIGLASLLY
ncbi:GntP family permease [Paraferrimonas sedimenticola]|uniref:Citrate transporter n=1 Tax=Paraferrimonas sedimenticola TaxID=375674 RepID=A0AA37RWH6_9GAMM|nr:GntP family permease [Paraferrimonas sedimenticola]GLP96636.1 citrate transporter [Paraferrimonas sedimenticola]